MTGNVIGYLLIALIVGVIVFLILREFNLWYWKVNELVRDQKELIRIQQLQADTLERIAAAVGAPAPAVTTPPAEPDKGDATSQDDSDAEFGLMPQ